MMRCLIDTNVLFSAALIPGGKSDQAFTKACLEPMKAYVCDYSVEELWKDTTILLLKSKMVGSIRCNS
jgi:predicted nucleic acid-binding protein